MDLTKKQIIARRKCSISTVYGHLPNPSGCGSHLGRTSILRLRILLNRLYSAFGGLVHPQLRQHCITGHATSTETREYLYSRIQIFIPTDTSPGTGVTGSGSRYLLRVLVSDVTIRAHFRGLEQTENILISGRHKNNTKLETVKVQREKDC